MSLSCSCKKVTKEHAAEREPVLRTGSLRFSVNQGAAPNVNSRSYPVDPRHAWMPSGRKQKSRVSARLFAYPTSGNDHAASYVP
jgi:hypothetical protein